MKNTGIIIARFQAPFLHDAHIKLIDYVKEKNERVILFLGSSETMLTINNPLSFEVRKQMVLQEYPSIEVYRLPDHKYDEKWNEELDKQINSLCKDDNVILYGSRDSFIKCYSGNYKTEFIESIIIEGLSATGIRKSIHELKNIPKHYRDGIIWASANKYPISYQTVDIAVVNFDTRKVLLGKKQNEDKLRFVGGFVDVDDTSLESAAKREVIEECSHIETSDYKYIGSYRIDDWRYRNEADKIMTAFFCCHYIYGRAQAKDDISELDWVSFDDLKKELFEPEHIVLFDALIAYLKIKTSIN